MTYYLVRVQEIPETGKDINFTTDSDEWFKKMVEESISGKLNGLEGTLSARLSKVERSIEITGGVYLKLSVVCDSCSGDFELEQQVPFRILLEPTKRNQGEDTDYEDISEVDDTLDFGYYSGDELDVGDIIRQHILMSQPIRHICKEGCKGLCQNCGKNLNDGPCGCVEEHSKSPFEVLKTYQGKH